MTEERKATDVLLAIEAHLLTLAKSMSTYDLMSKLTLDKVNKIYAYISRLELELAEEQKVQQAAPQQEMPSMQIDTSPVGTRRTSRVEAQPVQQAQQENKQLNIDNKKVPITQRITDNNGKDLFMAEVSVMNDKKEVVTKTKTNAVGKWQAHLKPGKYIVHIAKTDSATKNKLEAMQDIIVPNMDSTFTLPVAIIKRPV
jgi:hypothetical protein